MTPNQRSAPREVPIAGRRGSASEAWGRHYFSCEHCQIDERVRDLDRLCTKGARLRDAALHAKRGAGETRALVKRHLQKGLSPREIAILLGVSTQAVYQHIDSLREAGELPAKEEAS